MRALALAEELEVSVRTIDRDIDELSGAGRSDDCDYGGKMAASGWKTAIARS